MTMATPLPISPFLDPTKCDVDTLAVHMLSELNFTVGIVVRQIHEQHATQSDMEVIVDTLREAAMPRFLVNPSPEFLDACARPSS
jgi:hypothetical protein